MNSESASTDRTPPPSALTPVPAGRGMFATQLRGELVKLFARKRTYIGFWSFLAVEFLVLILVTLPRSRHAFGELMADNGLQFEDGYTGLTLAFFIIRSTAILLCPLYLALVAGELVAKEVEEGTMRMILARPVTRLRVFVLKALAGVIHTFVLMTFVAVTSLLAGVLYRRGVGNLLVLAPKHEVFALFTPGEGVWRYLRAILFLGLTYQTISALGLMFSCLKSRPAAAVTLTLSVVFVDFALRNIPWFYPYDEYFLTYHLACWVRTFQEVVLWPSILKSLILLTGLTLTSWIVGAAYFCSRDLKG